MAIEISGLPSAIVSNHGETTQADAAKDANSNHTATNANPPASDAVTLTRNAENLRLIEADINAASEVDGERIENLRLAIDTGVYRIDPLRVAEKFLQFETELTA